MPGQDPSPFARHGGYLPIEDHGLIGDGSTCALVARDGTVVWLCVPRFDSPPVFASILDKEQGGSIRVAPRDPTGGRQFYRGDTGVLVTEVASRDGRIRITDALALQPDADLHQDRSAAAGCLVRSVEVLQGPVTVEVAVQPVDHTPKLKLHTSHPLGDRARGDVRLDTGEVFTLSLSWTDPPPHEPPDVRAVLDHTERAWERWSECIDYDGVGASSVRRSAITLKLLDYFENGAIVAAATSSLPETFGGERNWDYRYVWIRDAAFSVYALRRIGLAHEAQGFLSWVLDTVERAGRAGVLYDLDGERPPDEREDRGMDGYRRSRPVRWGNAAADQTQNDAFGEIVDCAWQWYRHNGSLEPAAWKALAALIDEAAKVWRTPDHGIWEVRSSERVFTYSAAMCQVAVARGAALADHFGEPERAARWRRTSQEITSAILEEAWDDEVGALREQLGGGALDASILSLPLRRVIGARHPRMVATVEAVTRTLGAGDGLLYRYDHEASPDGLEGKEGAFLLCSFWLVDNLALQGRIDEAGELYESLCARGGHLGLLPEQIDASSGCFLGNYPQAFSHVGVISSAINLTKAMRGKGLEG